MDVSVLDCFAGYNYIPTEEQYSQNYSEAQLVFIEDINLSLKEIIDNFMAQGEVAEVKQIEVEKEWRLEVDDGVNLWLETAPEEIEVSLGDNKDRLVVQVPEREGVWTEGDFGDLVEAELTRQNIEASRGQIYVDWLDYERQSQETVMRFKFD